MNPKQNSEELSNVDLLIFLLVRFPHIFTINYNLVEAKLKLSFMLKININYETYKKFKKVFYESVQAYCELSKLESIPKINRKITKSWTLLQVTFNKKSITVEEINLVSNLILSEFKHNVIIDTRNDGYLEIKKTDKDDLIEYLLSRKKENEENLLAFREAGKVYVFDK